MRADIKTFLIPGKLYKTKEYILFGVLNSESMTTEHIVKNCFITFLGDFMESEIEGRCIFLYKTNKIVLYWFDIEVDREHLEKNLLQKLVLVD